MELQIRPILKDLLIKEKALDKFVNNVVSHLTNPELFDEDYDDLVIKFNNLDELQQLNSFHWHFCDEPTDEKYEYWLKISNKLVKQINKN